MKLKKFLPIALSAALMLNFSACSKKEKISDADYASTIVATVGDENISALDLKFYLKMYIEDAESEAGLDGKTDEEKKKYWKSKESEAKRLEIIDNTLENIKELKVLLANAKKDNVTLGQTETDAINQTIEEFIQAEGNGDKEEANKVMLRDYGVTVDQYKAIYEEFVLAYVKYAQERPASLEISDSEIEKSFEENKEEFDTVTVQHILLATMDLDTGEPLPEEEATKKKTLADDLLKKAQAGEDFAALVKEYTEDDGSKETGGEYTLSKVDNFVEEFKDWSFNAKEGDMGIVESMYGYHVMKFVKHTPPTLGDDVKATLKYRLQNDQFKENIDKMIAETQVIKNESVIDSLDLF